MLLVRCGPPCEIPAPEPVEVVHDPGATALLDRPTRATVAAVPVGQAATTGIPCICTEDDDGPAVAGPLPCAGSHPRLSANSPLVAARCRSMDRRPGETATRCCCSARTFRRRQARSRPSCRPLDRTARNYSASTPLLPNPSRDWSPSSRSGTSTTKTRSNTASRFSQRHAWAGRHQ